MKFLLCAINAKYIHSNPAVYSLKAYAGSELGKHVEIAEYTINQYMQEILADIYNRKPDVIGISCYIWNWNLVQEVLAELPKVLPEAPIWLGGPEVSFDAQKLMEQYPFLAGIMVGEGEETFRELLETYVKTLTTERETSGRSDDKQEVKDCQRLDFHNISGLCLHDGYTAPRPLTDMNRLPFLYEHPEQFANRIIYYESSRGCPYRCSYCLSSIDKKVRFRDLEIVKQELQFFLDQRVAQVKFVDRTFNCNHEHAIAIWHYLVEHDNGVTNFHFEISADILRPDELAILRTMRPGLVQLEIGVQSVNPNTLKAINRIMDVDKLEQIVASVHDGQNVHQHLDLIAGLPYEDYESFGKSFDRVYGMKPQQLQLGFLKVLKGSQMYAQAQEFGICYTKRPPYEVLYTRWLSYEDVLKLKKIEEMVELYYNSNQFTHTLPFLEKVFASPFRMFEELAAFYEEKGYFTNSPARAYRYQVLLDFACSKDAEHEEIYGELLTFDLYLRENMKSRPEFTSDLALYKEKIKAFYKEEEMERRYLPGYEAYDSRQMAKMTHLEPFRYPVWDMRKLQQYMSQDYASDERKVEHDADPVMVLFDYRTRNPLTYEAAVQVIVDICDCEHR